jgi:hypothetical protein
MNKNILKLLLLPWLVLPSVSCRNNSDSSTSSNNNDSSASVNTSTSEVLNKISNEKKKELTNILKT